MIRKALVATAIIAAFAVPAFAATTTTKPTKKTTTAYYVEQSVKTNRCYVTMHKPNGTTLKEIGTTSYATRTKAYAAMKAAPECKAKKKA